MMNRKLTISVPDLVGKFIDYKIRTCGYGSVSEVIREAMRGWLERQRRLAALDESIARGLADADAGRVQSVEEVRQELRERFAKEQA